jgi:integrase
VLRPEARIFSLDPDGGSWLQPESVGQRYTRMCTRLGWDMNIHQLRHYSATELIAAGVDIRTVAGRLGHSGGGATTLRVYSAWKPEADVRAAGALAGRMPTLPPGLSAPAVAGAAATPMSSLPARTATSRPTSAPRSPAAPSASETPSRPSPNSPPSTALRRAPRTAPLPT